MYIRSTGSSSCTVGLIPGSYVLSITQFVCDIFCVFSVNAILCVATIIATV